jgi:ribosomal protein S18 acetylase RimI-like enzyme
MKRLYVKPQLRRNKVGEELVKSLLKEAKEKGYQKMVLDTLERLHQAIKLYKRYGFQTTSAYYANPLPGVVYMEKQLV